MLPSHFEGYQKSLFDAELFLEKEGHHKGMSEADFTTEVKAVSETTQCRYCAALVKAGKLWRWWGLLRFKGLLLFCLGSERLLTDEVAFKGL